MVSARGKKFRGADVAPIFTKIEAWRISLASGNLFPISFLFIVLQSFYLLLANKYIV